MVDKVEKDVQDDGFQKFRLKDKWVIYDYVFIVIFEIQIQCFFGGKLCGGGCSIGSGRGGYSGNQVVDKVVLVSIVLFNKVSEIKERVWEQFNGVLRNFLVLLVNKQLVVEVVQVSKEMKKFVF